MRKLSEEEVLHRSAAYCSLAERCVHDVKKKLDAWEIEPPVQQRVLKRLLQEGFLDEARYCRSFVNDKWKFSRWGKNKILYALRAKGIEQSLIDKALSGIDPEENKEALIGLLRNKMRSVKAKDSYELRMKLLRFAAGRGYEPSLIYSCLDEIGVDDTE